MIEAFGMNRTPIGENARRSGYYELEREIELGWPIQKDLRVILVTRPGMGVMLHQGRRLACGDAQTASLVGSALIQLTIKNV